ncbi:MAG: small multi-drug export protein, partial [Planctomycetota bacterium]
MPAPLPESPQERHRFRIFAIACIGLAVVSLTVLIWREGWGALGRASAVGASAQIVGKWLIFVGAKADNPYGFGPWGISYTIFVLDLLIALVLNTFLPQFERLPRLGAWLIRTHEKTNEAYSKFPKLKRMAWTGVMLWVFLPLPASGAVTGSFASRLVGLSRTSATLAIVVGS